MTATTLRGLAWDHPRSYQPLDATSSWADVRWERRSLDRFNDEPLEGLLADYDLVVIDHPFVGRAAHDGLLVPVEELVDADTFDRARRDCVGIGHSAYQYDSAHWAVDVDTACQVSLRARSRLAEAETPRTWADVGALAARRPRRVGLPLAAADAWCAVLSLTSLLGRPATADSLEGVEPAFELLRELVSVAHPDSLSWNPPAAIAAVGSGEVDYVPLLFGYAIASRTNPELVFENAPFEGGAGGPLLGGSGVAVPAASPRREAAGKYVRDLLSPRMQHSVLAPAGGQPPSRSVWSDPDLDQLAGGFFSRTVLSVESAFVRPRSPWWPSFQLAGSRVLHSALVSGDSAATVYRSLLRLRDEAVSR